MAWSNGSFRPFDHTLNNICDNEFNPFQGLFLVLICFLFHLSVFVSFIFSVLHNASLDSRVNELY